MDTDVIYAERYSLNYNSVLNCRRYNRALAAGFNMAGWSCAWPGGPGLDYATVGRSLFSRTTMSQSGLNFVYIYRHHNEPRLHGNFQPGLKLNVRAGGFFFYLLYKDSTHAFMNFLPRKKFLVDYMGNFSPINRAENLISSSSNRADVSAPPHGMISSCDRRLRFTKIYVISP